MRICKGLVQLLLALVISAGCKKKFDPPAIQTGLSALVIDGFLNNSPDTTFIHLSRSKKLVDTLPDIQENNAQLFVEDPAGNIVYSFQQLNDSGLYFVPGMGLDINTKYRLHIITANGKQYQSDEIPVVKTPPVDSITFDHTATGLDIDVNTHDPLNATKYYRWEYTETWQYHAAYYAYVHYDHGNFIDFRPGEFIYECWRTQPSTQLLLGSTERLSKDLVYHYVLRQIDQDAVELSMKYFISVKQYALTKDAYEYIQNLKKSTEQTGSIFDPQPSEMKSNIHSLTDSSEVVLGYLTASTAEKKELYITNDQVQPWKYNPGCELFRIYPADFGTFSEHGVVPIEVIKNGLIIQYVNASTYQCGDCRALGGITTKPGFWH